MFRDREEAGLALAQALSGWRGRRPVVYAIPRGGIVLAAVIAEALDGDLDVVLTHKLGAPGNPELAIGAIAESGWHFLHGDWIDVPFEREHVRCEIAAQLELLQRRRAHYAVEPIAATGRIAIVVDDGLATGATMTAALHTLREQRPQRLVCAVPVAAPFSLERIKPLADEVVCLVAPRDFEGVGDFYECFAQVEDEEVVDALRRARLRRPSPPALSR